MCFQPPAAATSLSEREGPAAIPAKVSWTIGPHVVDGCVDRRRREDAPFHDRADHRDPAGARGQCSARDLILRHGISRSTMYHWKKPYGDLQVSDAERLKTLEDDNRRLKRLVADQALSLQLLKDVLGNER